MAVAKISFEVILLLL